VPDRAALQQEIEKQEANMRAPQGSPGWTEYWRGGGSQRYVASLQASETLAGGAAAPALHPAMSRRLCCRPHDRDRHHALNRRRKRLPISSSGVAA
jgi:hypothetical protein